MKSRLRKHPYWKHLFSRYKLRGWFITWCLNAKSGWFRIGGLIVRWRT